MNAQPSQIVTAFISGFRYEGPQVVFDLLGDSYATSQGEIARAFGVTAETVRKEWRANGMPGEPRKYVWREVLAWYLERRSKEHPLDEELAEVVRKQRLQAAKTKLAIDLQRERMLTREESQWLARDGVERDVRSLLGRFRDELTNAPRRLKPDFRAEVSDELLAEWERVVRISLQAAADKWRRDYQMEVEPGERQT